MIELDKRMTKKLQLAVNNPKLSQAFDFCDKILLDFGQQMNEEALEKL